MSQPVLGVVPARLASERLPRKPLHPILGRPLLEWVWRRLEPMQLFDRVVIATDSDEIERLCVRIGAPVVRTRSAHASGTDRVAEVVERPEFREFPLILNVQGDEPLVREADLSLAVGLVRDDGWGVGTLATPVRDPEALHDPSVVKVARSERGEGLYFSRAPIPFRRDGEPEKALLAGPPFLRHVGIYAARRENLLRWVALPPSPLEEVERLEQLRALEAGISIGVALVDDAAPGVDTLADVRRIEALLLEDGESLRAGPEAPE